MGAVVISLGGCSQDGGQDSGDGAGVPDPTEIAEDPGEANLPPASTLAGGTTETARLWSDATKAQSKKLAKLLLSSDAPDANRSGLTANTVEIFDTDAFLSEERYVGQSIRVVERSLTDDQKEPIIEAESTAFVRRIRDLLFLNSDETQHQVHFKLFGIRREGEQLRTRQRLKAKGRRAGKEVRSHGVVDATWEIEEDMPPRLISFMLPKLVQHELLSGPEALFEDVAGGVLGSNSSWSGQLQLGMNAWARRIERSLKPDFLGYHGIAVGDVDGDELEDVYLCQPGGLPNLLFRQQADGRFVDISSTSGVDWLDNSTAALLVDLDNDGDADLAVATQRAFLIMENDGAGMFSLVARLPNVGLGYSPTAADYDLDGDLDLLVLRYTADSREIGDFPTPHPFHDARNGGSNVLLENQGGFQFADVTGAKGLGAANYRFSFAASWDDYDNDGDLDLYVANDFGPNQLFRNEGGSFADVSVESGTQDWGFGMSATWADYDRDGRMDLYVSSMFSGAGNQIIPQSDFNPTMPNETRAKYLKMVRGNTLMRNSGDGRFADVTSPMAEGFAGWAWGAKFADLNNDGWEDLYVANGYISQPDTEDL